jgi:hypothetical protein
VAAKTSAWLLGIAQAIPGMTALVFSGMLAAVVSQLKFKNVLIEFVAIEFALEVHEEMALLKSIS